MNNSNSKDNSNSNNSNNNHSFYNSLITYKHNRIEQLFYQVIHNKYLFNKIIQQIHNSKWVDYIDFNQITINNRIKFKDLQSVKWMIEHDQFELLKSKLDAGDPLNFEISLHDLIKKLPPLYSLSVFKLILNSTSIFNKDQLINHSLHLFSPSLIIIAINQPYSIPISISTLEKSCIQSTPEQIFTFWNHICESKEFNFNYNCTSSVISSGDNRDCSNIGIKRKRVQFEDNDNNNNNDNNKLVALNKYLKLIYRIQDLHKRNSALEKIVVRINKSKSQEYLSKAFPSLDLDVILFNINSTIVQKYLISNKFYSTPTQLESYKGEIEQLANSDNLERLYIYVKSILQSPSTRVPVYALISPELNSTSQATLKFNSEISTLVHDQNSTLNFNSTIAPTSTTDLNFIKYSPESLLNYENLEIFLVNNQNDWKETINELNSIEFKQYIKVGFKFIEYYIKLDRYEKYKWFRVNYIDSIIESNLKARIHDHWFVRGIKSLSITSRSDSKWFKFYRNLKFVDKTIVISIDSAETIDFILENFNKEDDFGLECNHVSFSSLMVLDLAMEKSKDIKSIIGGEPGFYSNLIVDYISLGNYSKVEEIFTRFSGTNSQGGRFRHSLRDRFISAIDKLKGLNTIGVDVGYSNKLKLMESFIKKNRWSFGVYSCLGLFLSNMSRFIYDLGYLMNTEYQALRCKLLVMALKNICKSRLELIFLNKLNPILENPTLCNQLWNSATVSHDQLHRPTFLNIGGKMIFGDILDEEDNTNSNKMDDIQAIYQTIECIKLLLEYNDNEIHRMCIKDINNSFHQVSVNIGRKELLESMVNYLFKRMLHQFKLLIYQFNHQLPEKLIHETYSLINQSLSIKVHHNSTLLSFYYLSIKSNLFIKYILYSPLFDVLNTNSDYYYYSIPETNNLQLQAMGEFSVFLNLFDIRSVLDPLVFSYDFIFNNNSGGCSGDVSGDINSNNDGDNIVLSELINQLSYKLIREGRLNRTVYNSQDKLNRFQDKLLNYNLEYCLDIGRMDLFIQHLEIIKTQFKAQFDRNAFQFSKKLIKMCCRLDLVQVLEENLTKLANYPEVYENSKYLKYFNHLNNYSTHSNSGNNQGGSIISGDGFSKLMDKVEEKIFQINNAPEEVYELQEMLLNNDKIIIKILENYLMYIINRNQFLTALSFNCFKLYLSKYPNNPLFKISKSLILYAIDSNKYSFLKFIYDNKLVGNTINQNNDYDQLENFLIQQLNKLQINK